MCADEQLIGILDIVQDHRQLSHLEVQQKSKNRSLKDELEHQSWTHGLWRMESVNEMASFIKLLDLVQNVQLIATQDTIRWKWTVHGDYTSMSMYC